MQQIESLLDLRKNVPKMLVITFICFSIAIILGGLFFYKSQRNRIFTENQNALTAISILKIGQIEQWHKERMGDASTIRNNGALVRSIKQYFDTGDSQSVRKELLTWMESVYTGYDYSGVCILDSHKKTRLSVSKFDSIATDDIENEISKVFEEQSIVLTDLHKSKPAGKVFIDLLIPLTEPGISVNNPFGILILRIDPGRTLFPLIQSWPTSSKSAETLLIRKDGDSVLYLNDLRHQQNTTLNLTFPVNDNNLPAAKAVNGFVGVVEGLDYRHVPVVGYVSPIPDFNWFIVAKIDKDEIQQPIKRWSIISVVVSLLIILFFGTVLLFWIRNQQLSLSKEYLRNELKRKQLDEALIISETRYRRLFEAARDGILIFEPESGSIVDVNPYLVELLGITSEQFLGKSIWEIGFFKDIVINKEKFLKVQHSEYALHDNFPLETSDGRKIHVEFISSLYEVSGYPVIQCNIRDITERKEMEDALREWNSKFRKLSSNAPGMIFQFTRRLDGTYCVPIASEGIKDIYGYSPKDVIDDFSPIAKIILPEDLEIVVRDIEYSAKHLTLFDCDYRAQIPGKPVKWLNTKSTPEKLEDGSITWYGFISDITERINSESKLRESEIKFRQTFDLSPVGIVMVGLDKKFLRCNKSFSNSLGYNVEELEGKTISDITLPEDENIGMNEMVALAKGKIETAHVQKRYVRIDGSIVLGDVLISLVRDKNFNAEYFLAIIQDITESKSAENEIRLQSEIMSHMAEAVYLVKMKDGIIVFANSKFESMFGYEKGEMIGKHVSIVNALTEKSPEETAREIMSSLMLGGIWTGEILNIKKDGTPFWTQANVTIFDHSQFGEVLISVQNDITERKNAELQIKQLNEELEQRVLQRTQQLEVVNKELEAFSYSVSHDLRAPLRSVHGYTKILLEEYDNKIDDEGKRICKIISSSATQMGGLIDDLLSFSRIGRSALNPSVIDMKKMVRLLFDGMTSPSERERIVITIGKLHKSLGDVALIGQVWINLLSNAIKYSSKMETSEISVGSSVSGDIVTYFVKDNGVGFDMQYVHKLFGVFQRLHTEREFEGNGVGLAIIQRIILKHGGNVWAEGEVGKGATFYFSMPVNDEKKDTKKEMKG